MKPDIQALLRRHLYGTKSDRDRLEEAMAGVRVTEDLAREAATKSVLCHETGNATGAKRAEAEARKWLTLQAKYRSRLL